MYTIKTTDCKGDGATYAARTRHDVLATMKRLLEHGTKFYGDKIVELTVVRVCKQTKKS